VTPVLERSDPDYNSIYNSVIRDLGINPHKPPVPQFNKAWWDRRIKRAKALTGRVWEEIGNGTHNNS